MTFTAIEQYPLSSFQRQTSVEPVAIAPKVTSSVRVIEPTSLVIVVKLFM